MKKIAYININSWSKSCIGAIHYYVHIVTYDMKGIEINHPITAKEASLLNRNDPSFTWRRGQRYTGFLTKEDAIKWSIKYFRKKLLIKDDYEFLLLGNPISNDIKYCLWAKDELKQIAINLRFNEYQTLNREDDEECLMMKNIEEDIYRIIR